MNNGTNFLRWLASMLLVAIVAIGVTRLPIGAALSTGAPSATTGTEESLALQGDTTGTVAAVEGTLQEIYQRVNPAVVSIQVIGGRVSIPRDGEIPGMPRFPSPGPLYGEGSGWVWDDAGHIVTNYHVVERGETIYVKFADGTILDAEVVGTDPESDLAVLRVEPSDNFEWPEPVTLADADDVAVGQLAIAIGNPFGEEGTMTLGIVSGLGRLLPTGPGSSLGRYSIPDIIQTDAAINPGNSGGVLLNERGELIGVPTAIASATGSNSGVGYAIPVNIVARVVPALIEQGDFENPYLGISGLALFPELSEVLGLDRWQKGALVVEVVPDGPADRAGVQGSSDSVTIAGVEYPSGGDVVIAIDGEPVDDLDDLISYLANHGEVGGTVELTILREGAEERVEVTLDARPVERVQEIAEVSPEQPFPVPSLRIGAQLGILASDLTGELAAEAELPEDVEGVLVREVFPRSAAAEAGLERGDVITSIDGEAITSVRSLRAALSEVEPGDTITLSIIRDGEEMEINVAFPSDPE